MNAPGVRSNRTPDRRTRHVENDDYAKFVARVIRAHGRRVAEGDIEGLADLAALLNEVTRAVHTGITGLRLEGPGGRRGHSWADIAEQLGVNRSAAQERWGKSPDADGQDSAGVPLPDPGQTTEGVHRG